MWQVRAGRQRVPEAAPKWDQGNETRRHHKDVLPDVFESVPMPQRRLPVLDRKLEQFSSECILLLHLRLYANATT